MKLSKVHHIAIICSDYQRSLDFYTKTLGLRQGQTWAGKCGIIRAMKSMAQKKDGAEYSISQEYERK